MDSIEGLSPAISIEQRTTSKNPRSTVGTVTEIYDYLRLLYASIGKPHCPKCGRPIQAQTVQEMVDRALRLPEGSRFTVLAPYVVGQEGRVQEADGRDAQGGVPARAHRRAAPRPRQPARAGQAEEAHDRARRGPAGREEGGRRRLPQAPGRLDRDGDPRLGRPRHDRRGRRPGGGALGQLRLPRLRHVADRDHAAPLLLQLAVRRLHGLLGPRDDPEGGRGPPRRRSGEVDRRRRDRHPEARLDQLAVAPDGDARQALQVPPGPALLEAAQGGAEGDPVRLGRGRDPVLLRRRAGRVPLALVLRRPRADARAPVPRDGEPGAPRGARGLHVRRALPVLQGAAAQARGAGGQGGRPLDRRGRDRHDRRVDRVLRRAAPDRARAGDRRQDPEGSQRPTRLPRQRRDRLPLAVARRRRRSREASRSGSGSRRRSARS